MSQKVRRVVALLLALTFIASLMPHGLRAATADVKIVMVAATDMPMSSGKCDGCGDHQMAMTAAACSAYCNSFVALPSTETLLEPPSIETVRDAPALICVGHTIPPDPYPPRPAVLS
jgi:hypothetical protein